MFRIESYVTPVIMEYVAKYVKNIRSEDMQLSLWEGEATLQNLDLRLDVLEEELQLPCEFLSGHVHELTIRVPWTKITSEPIRIIINTIEFVLKLRRDKPEDVSSASSSPQRKTGDNAKKRRRSEEQQPTQQTPGSGIVNKIINNISLECQNIILKYVEDDIVVSMNVQLLQFGAADERWKMTMTDVHPVKVLMRKLVKVSDLTICIDKRNSAGHIEVCQEPILYRCSFEVRILRKYNTNTMTTTSLTRIGIFTKSMDVNITSMQFPMVMRLIDITRDFGRNNTKNLTTEQEDVIVDQESEAASRDSFLLWAWNKLPTLSFEPPVFEEPNVDEVAGHLRDIGLYLEELNVTLKNSELIVDTFVSNTKRIKYTPIVRLTLGGLYFEKVSCEDQNWRSMKSGISYLIVDPLGSYKVDDISEAALITSSSLEKLTGFMENSLFDEKITTLDNKVCTSYNEYMSTYTDEYLLNRTPIIAFDSVEYKTTKMRDNRQTEHEATAQTVKDTHLAYRVLSSGLTFRWNQSFRQVKQTIQDLIDSYDYSGYHVDQLDTVTHSSTCKLPPPLMEDYDELMEHIPLCIYKFDLKNINFEIYTATEPTSATQKHTHNRLPSAMKLAMPYFLLHIKHLDGTFCRPLHVDKLVHTTCQLPEKPHNLLDACNDNYAVHMSQLSLSMMNRMRKTTVRLMHIPHIHLTYSDLLQKQHWKEDILIPLRKVDLNFELIFIDFNKRNLIIAERLLNCVLSYRPYLLWKIANQTMQIIKNESEPTLHTEIRELHIEFQCFQSYNAGYIELQRLLSHVVTYTEYCRTKHLLMDSERGNNIKKWLSASIQLNPEGLQTAANKREALIALAVWMEPISVFIDATLLEFLKYQEEYDHTVEKEPSSEVELHSQQYQTQTPSQTHVSSSQPARVHTNITTNSGTGAGPPLMRRSSRNSLPSRKISHPEETIHFSSERDEKVDLETVSVSPSTEATTTSLWQQIRALVICFELGHITLNISEKMKWHTNGEDVLNEYTQIQLPKISMRSTNAENLSRTNLQEKFIIYTTPKDTINWVIALYGFNLKRCNSVEVDILLPDVYTTATIVVTHKKQMEANVAPAPVTALSATKEKPNELIAETVAHIDGCSSPLPPPTEIVNTEINTPTTQAQNNDVEVDAITVHIDTMPIHFHVSEAKCKALHTHVGILGRVITLIGPMAQLSASAQMQKPPPPMRIVTASEENAAIKHFLELETSSSVSSVFLEKKNTTVYTTSLFCQWSIAKIICELTAKERKSKMVLELEDLLSTVDKREDFTKFTGKVGQCNLLYYTPDADDGWIAQPGLRLKMLGDVTNMPFLNFVYTSVGLKSFYTRIGVKPKYDANRSIAEIIVTIQAMEIIIDVDVLKEFVGSLGMLFVTNGCNTSAKETSATAIQANPPTAADLPLIHLDSKGFTMYTPLSTNRECCTVLIWKIESLKVTPTLENPLQRTPIRPDVYSKAAQLGFLNTPGSLVEDRQYELVLQNLSVSSGEWAEILGHMAQQAKTFQHTNPAVEWNSQHREASPHITDIFSRFTFTGIFAPCISYNNVLICGQALEFNCASDFVAKLNTDQLYALGFMAYCLTKLLDTAEKSVSLRKSSNSCILLRKQSRTSSQQVSTNSTSTLQCGELLIAPGHKNKSVRNSTPAFEPIDENTEHVKTDSGIQSQLSRVEQQSTRNTLPDTSARKFPQTVSFIAGTFTIDLYGLETTKTDESLDKCKSKASRLVPLLTLTVSQPSFMFTQNIYDNITQMSVFNLNIHSMPTASLDAESASMFPIEFIDTRPGELGPTGIPPPLVTIRKHITKQRLVETDVEIARPIIITLQEQQTVVLLQNSLILYQTILRSGYFNPRSLRTVQSASKLMLMRNHFYDCDRLHVKLDKVMILMKHASDYEGKLVCADMHFSATFLQRPEKAVLKASVGSLHLQVGDRIFLHPVAIRSSVAFVSEPWFYLPLVSGTIKFDVIHLDVDVSVLKELQRMQQGLARLSVRLNEEWKTFLRNRPPMGEPSEVSTDNLVPLKTPSFKEFLKSRNISMKRLTREEFYQDDLRAGAFQFVEMSTDSFLPLPYQIQIIKKNFGIICWRYPQPRKMCKIQVFPVPMAVQKPINIRCQMEYFSESHECFLHFSEFWLSETSSKDIVLPEREICANIWRVVIMQSLVAVNGECFEISEEEEEDKIPSLKIEDIFKLESNDEDFILHPKVLVGCMRIDTAFQSECVPKLQMLLSCASLQMKFFNQVNYEYKLPPALAEYTLAPAKQISQAFLIVLLEKLSIHAAFNSSHIYSIDSSLTLNVKCLDYGFLNMLSVLEDAKLQSYVTVNKLKRQLNINAVLERFRINFGPSILHTLLSSKAHWEELFKTSAPSDCHVLLPKCIVVNRMQALVSFGQTGTTERVQLQPLECSLYSFGNDGNSQELTFFVADNETRMTDASQSVAIPFKFDGERLLQSIRIGDKCLIIELQKLSATQVVVLLKGQIELVSMVPQELRVELRFDESQGTEEKRALEYLVKSEGYSSFYAAVQRTSNVFMRLKLVLPKIKGRTGDIPLKPNKKLPWLVKVPTINNEFVSFWVRVIREDMTDLCSELFEPQRILVTIWPIFELQSRLPCPLTANESTTGKLFEIAPRGGRNVLDVPATHLTEHKIEFNAKYPLNCGCGTEQTLSLKSMQWNSFFWYDENAWGIDDALHKLKADTVPPTKWPIDDEDELRVERISHCTDAVDLVYRIKPAREFSCSTCLEVTASAMFINATGLDIGICIGESNERTTIKSNCLEMLGFIGKSFTIGLPLENSASPWVCSMPVFANGISTGGARGYILPDNDSVDIAIVYESEVYKFVLESKIEHEKQVFRLRPKYVIANFANCKLELLTFAIDHKESAQLQTLVEFTAHSNKLGLNKVQWSDNCVGQTINSFHDLRPNKKAKRTKDTAYICFISLKLPDREDFSIPIPLSIPFTRRSFALQNGEESLPLVATLIEKDRIYYFNVFEDNSPALLVTNQTDVSFIIAQTSASENSKVSNTTAEYNGRHFEWYQPVPAYSKCYYTPPELYTNFPDVESTTCNITLALYKDNPTKKTLKWSKPIRTDRTWEKFLYIPNHGDVKVIVCDKHRVTRIFVYYIAQLEFSVKDLRSRLLTSKASTDAESPNSSLLSISPSTAIHEPITMSRIPAKCRHFSNECNTKTQLKIRCFIKELIVSLHADGKTNDCTKSEIVSLYADDTLIAFDDDDDDRELHLLLPNLQLDNQNYVCGQYDFPVVLCAQQLYERKQTVPPVHFLDRTYQILRNRGLMAHFNIGFFEDEMKLHSIVCTFSPMRIYIEDSYLNCLLDAIVDCTPSNCAYRLEQSASRITLSSGEYLLPRVIVGQAMCIAEPLQIREFQIEPLSVLLSVHTSIRLYIALDHSPLSFSTYNRQHILTMPLRFGQSLSMHYLSGAIFGAGWVVGSLEILGSPSGLARSFTTGLRDFVSMPVEGLFRGPWGFIVGITQGSASLLRNVTAGTLNSVSKLAASVARNLDRLTLDQEHIERTEALRRCRPHGFTEGLAQGVTGLGISILGAVGGLARHTLEARSPVEVMTGVGKGLVGAVTKPLSGAAELLALTGQGVLHTVGFNTMPELRVANVCVNIITEPSAYRVWKLLPGTLKSDQILFNHEVTLATHEQLRQGYALLTSSVFALMELQSYSLICVIPIDKLEMTSDALDKTLYYIHLVKDKEGTDEENYTNQRIITYIHSSTSLKNVPTTAAGSLSDLLQSHEHELQVSRRKQTDWSFYINETLGEHIIKYLRVMNRNC
ncbi:intermembrane lipid transfer protein VPS13B isoform X2 [Zeugodacus cucurbitae]|uniref:intermembrane lipid transfer protein VPS13B isoform X2 n=1 Tax=Zeugodacus cucurbitae TaxID=28588 RepID=UPI0023D96E72|nr:intermembrane lipid transfer protein VPS13B isoform X2 [Zeugodacus cucurbitae]